jgi:hypothetical protein
MAYAEVGDGKTQGFTGIVSCGSPAQPMKMDFQPPGASVGIAFNVTLSAGGDLYSIGIGSTVIASYVPLSNQVGEPVKSTGMGNVTETWTRVK